MSIIHEHEKKQFKKLFREQGVDEFDKRFQVLEFFLKSESHETCEEITKKLNHNNIFISIDFVTETMNLLCKFGFAHIVKFNDGILRYEHRHLGMHHDHMVCIKCEKIIEFKDEKLELQQVHIAAAYGFQILQHKMEIYGLCSKCLGNRAFIMSLAIAKQGEFFLINRLEGGKKIQIRCASMGIKIGEIIEVVSAQRGGQLVIAIGESRFIIGQGFAEKIMVQPSNKIFIDSNEFDEFADNKELSKENILLSEMKQGQEGIIIKVSGQSVLRRRLLEMGMNRGTKVFVEKYAPLKDPIELVVKGYHVSLRVKEASNIMVQNVRCRK